MFETTCGSITAGLRLTTSAFVNMRWIWSRRHRDVILTNGSVVVTPLLQATRIVPIVFVVVPDPVGAGFVDSLARPGGNATGFIQFEYGLSGKWLELLKELAPRMTRAAVLRDASIPSGTGQFGAIQSVAPSVGVEVSPVNIRDAGEIERAVAAFASREWWPDCDRQRAGAASSQFDHHAGRPAQTARSLFRTVLCDCRRPDFLRA